MQKKIINFTVAKSKLPVKFITKCLIKRLGKKGFEPLTPWFVATCSSPLSYKPFYYFL